jgi:hypothetical protein
MKKQIPILFVLFLFCFINRGAAQEVKINHDGTNGFAIEEDGTIRADGEAQTWRDELQPLIGKRLDNGKGTVAINLDEFTVNFKSLADYEEGVVMNIQLNHDWDGISPIKPHLHWFQNQDKIPNWLIAYRWHQNGEAKVTTWTYQDVINTVFPYTDGTILQICNFGSITPPASPAATDVSSILQLKLMRDNGNTPYVYSAKDTYTGDAEALSLDIHIKTDTEGSRTEFQK